MKQLAHAKLTRRLHMTGVRPDGYHLIDAEMVSLDLADILEFGEGNGLSATGPFADQVPLDASNLISKALAVVGKQAMVRVEKHIPAGGGLGGGSSDAAAALRWANCTDLTVAAGLGADVAFCVAGGRAEVSGIGEIIQPLTYESIDFTLLLPPFGVNTAAVYQEFDREPETSATLANHLEPAAIRVEPRLKEWRDKFADWTGADPVLAGSGSTWFVEGNYPAPSESELAGARWINTRTVDGAAILG